MIWKTIKYTVAGTVAVLVVGGLIFGTSLGSYLHTSATAVQQAVKDSVPIEFELKRARDLLDEIIPEMQDNVRQIAQEEVEIASLQDGIKDSKARLDDQAKQVAGLRALLNNDKASYTVRGVSYERADIRDELARRLESTKEAQVVLSSKQRVLESRRKALVAAEDMLERTRSTKALLEDRIEALTAQYRMVQAASVGSEIAIDQSKLNQTQDLLDQIHKRLDVAERVLAHESRFTKPLPIVETLDEGQLLNEVDAFLAGRDKAPAVTADTAATLSQRNAD